MVPETSILVVDDNPEIREIIRILLEAEGFFVAEAANGDSAACMAAEHPFDLFILDIMMPGPNGYQTCRRLRELTNAPILFLSARTTDNDKTLGFSCGGDDYLAKPFSHSELVGRARALIRRYQVYQGKTPQKQDASAGQNQNICIRHLAIHTDSRTVFSDGTPVELTDTEYELLTLLASHRKQIFSAQHLYESVWNEPYYYGASNTVMVHIRNLRKKIEKDPQKPEIIENIWGKGYRLGKQKP